MGHYTENPDHGGASSQDAEGNTIWWVCDTCGQAGGNLPISVAQDHGIEVTFNPDMPIPPKVES